MEPDGRAPSPAAREDRRDAVLRSALHTFARFGYRRTSMEEVARTADISRPGLYFLFDSKEALFRAAVTRALDDDLAAIERVLGETGRPLAERLLAAFDRWAGRYVGPLTADVTAVIEGNPELLGDLVDTAPSRFEALVGAAVADASLGAPAAITQTLISASIGIKRQAGTRATYLERLEVAIALIAR